MSDGVKGRISSTEEVDATRYSLQRRRRRWRRKRGRTSPVCQRTVRDGLKSDRNATRTLPGGYCSGRGPTSDLGI